MNDDSSPLQPFRGLWPIILAAILKAYSAPDDIWPGGTSEVYTVCGNIGGKIGHQLC